MDYQNYSIKDCTAKSRKDLFDNIKMRTKEDLLAALHDEIESIKKFKYPKGSDDQPISFFEKYINLIDLSCGMLERMTLFQNLEDCWYYDIEIRETDLRVRLNYYDFTSMPDGVSPLSYSIKTSITVLKLNTNLLHVNQYAIIHGVGEGTVRQWIRRGKIRSAIKKGGEWRIPELARKSGRTYNTIMYHIDDNNIEDIPEQYSFITNKFVVMIDQDLGDRNKYHIRLVGDYGEDKLTMNTAEKEKLEIYLISSPYIRAESTCIKELKYKVGFNEMEFYREMVKENQNE